MSLKTVTIEINGERVQGHAVRGQNELWVHVQNKTFAVPLPNKSQGRKGARAGVTDEHSGEIVAPMPGKIIKLACKTGDSVKAGQSLVVMEAMKMEYSLKAPFDGKVTLTDKKPGDQVTMGEKLAHVAKA